MIAKRKDQPLDLSRCLVFLADWLFVSFVGSVPDIREISNPISEIRRSLQRFLGREGGSAVPSGDVGNEVRRLRRTYFSVEQETARSTACSNVCQEVFLLSERSV
jgi:hypothetical protein